MKKASRCMKALNSLNFPKKMKETKMREEGGRGSYFVLQKQFMSPKTLNYE